MKIFIIIFAVLVVSSMPAFVQAQDVEIQIQGPGVLGIGELANYTVSFNPSLVSSAQWQVPPGLTLQSAPFGTSLWVSGGSSSANLLRFDMWDINGVHYWGQKMVVVIVFPFEAGGAPASEDDYLTSDASKN